jgi:ubiquinone/menaquinone biosynthesis C-methylase UbiE
VLSAILEALFGILYGPGARLYDRFTSVAFAGEWQRWQSSAVPSLPRDGFIVELGSGTGAFAAECAAAHDAWLGLDISQEMTNVASRLHHPPKPMFVRASAAAMPMRSRMADAVVATFPSRYILDPNVAQEIWRVSKPGGLLVIVLSAELDAVGVRRRCMRALSAILQGRPGRADGHLPKFTGFDGQCQWRPTKFGRALVYVGRRL